MTLLGEDLGALVSAVELSRAAVRLVRQNIGLVALPNGMVLALALLGRVSPLAATLVNNGSTVVAAARHAFSYVIRSIV